MTTLNHISGGPDESWFYEVTVEIEAEGAPAVLSTLLTQDAIERLSEVRKEQTGAPIDATKDGDLAQERYVVRKAKTWDGPAINAAQVLFTGALTRKAVALYSIEQLQIIHKAVSGMVTSLRKMSQGCMPFIFYHRIRPFLSGWKSNPSLPNGIVYVFRSMFSLPSFLSAFLPSFLFL